MPEVVQRIEYRKGPYFAPSGDFSSAGAADIAYMKKLDAPFDLANGVTPLGAPELMRNDGPWTLREGLKRSNAVLGLSGGSSSTQRSSLSAAWHDQHDDGTRTKVAGYVMRYRLDLNSNFTYALDNPAEGDQFKQRDSRSVFGLSAGRSTAHALFGLDAQSDWGLQLRHDRIRVGLYNSVAKRITATTREDRVRETQLGLYSQTALQFTPVLRGSVGLRADRVDNQVTALSLADKVPPLASTRGYEVGARTEALPGLQSSMALWKLDFDSELVYVGDAGAT